MIFLHRGTGVLKRLFLIHKRGKNSLKNIDNYQVYRVQKSKFADPGIAL